MRIGIEAFRLFRKHKHGMDIVAIELIRQLQLLDTQNQYFIFCFDDCDQFILHETNNFKIIKLSRIPSPIAEQFILPVLVYKYKLDLLHSTGNTAPLFCNCRQIITLHDIIYLEKNNKSKGGTTYQRLGNFYRKIIVPLVIRKAEKVITVSESEYDKIATRFPSVLPKLEIIPNSYGKHFCVKPGLTTESTLIRYKLPFNGYIFMHGNTDPKKNLTNLLKAIYLLKEKGKLNYKVVISDIPEKKIFSKLKKYNLLSIKSDLIITNYINNFSLPDIYNRALIFLYPSLRESFGVPILEAMACGTPVITSDCASMPAVAGKAALLINPQDPQDIANAIEKLSTNIVLQEQLKEKGLAQIKKFSWKKSAELLLCSYQVELQVNSFSIQY